MRELANPAHRVFFAERLGRIANGCGFFLVSCEEGVSLFIGHDAEKFQLNGDIVGEVDEMVGHFEAVQCITRRDFAARGSAQVAAPIFVLHRFVERLVRHGEQCARPTKSRLKSVSSIRRASLGRCRRLPSQNARSSPSAATTFRRGSRAAFSPNASATSPTLHLFGEFERGAEGTAR